MTEKESHPNDKTPFAAVMPRSSSFTLLSAEKHSQRFSENECSIEDMTYEQLLQLQYLPHKPIIRQPVCTYSIPKTLKSSYRKNNSENPSRIHDRTQEKNEDDNSDDFGQSDTEEINRVEQIICTTDYRCYDADKKVTGNTYTETNCDTTTNTENDTQTFERNLKQNKEMLATVTEKFREKHFEAEKQNVKDDHKNKEESNGISIRSNVLHQEKMDRNEKVEKFLKGLPEMPSTSYNLKSTLYEEEKNSTLQMILGISIQSDLLHLNLTMKKTSKVAARTLIPNLVCNNFIFNDRCRLLILLK